MKRSQIILKMERVHACRYMMVESGHLTVKQFMDELLTTVEESSQPEPLKEVTCTKALAPYITKGKKYKVTEELHKMYYLIADDGSVRAFNQSRFE